jgi:hypothetical protein
MGVASFVFAGLMQLVALVWGPAPVGKYNVSVVFAPDPTTNALPEPAMRLLPANTTVQRNVPFVVDHDTTLSIGVDEIVRKTRNLTETAQTLTKVNATLSAEAARSASGGEATLAPAELRRLDAINAGLQTNLRRGDFVAAAVSSRALRDVTAKASQ